MKFSFWVRACFLNCAQKMMCLKNFDFSLVFKIMPLNLNYLATCSDYDRVCFYNRDQNIWKSFAVIPGQKKVGKHCPRGLHLKSIIYFPDKTSSFVFWRKNPTCVSSDD